MPLSPEQNHALRAEIIVKAESRIGIREIGDTNSGPEVDHYLAFVGLGPGYAWCMAFACETTGDSAEAVGLNFEDTNLIKTGSCAAQADHARALGALIPGNLAAGQVRPGDVMVVWEGGNYHHSGPVVAEPDADGVFQSVEGNTNDNGGREGTTVLRHTRNCKDSAEDGHCKYAFVRLCD